MKKSIRTTILLAVWLAQTAKPGFGKTMHLSKEQRNFMLRQVTFLDVSHPISADDLELPSLQKIITGPPSPIQNLAGEQVYCRYFQRRNSGTNPKFRCWLTNQDGQYVSTNGDVISGDSPDKVELKVKYRRNHKPNAKKEKDMYTEVFGSHLLWTLGYGADRVYPTREVRCLDCPRDPFSHHAKAVKGQIIIFPDAALEWKYPGATLEHHHDQGWSFKELERLQKNRGAWTRTQRIHFESLALLMGFLVHSSNRGQQQRLVCPLGDDRPDPAACQQPLALVHDLGSIMGAQNLVLGTSESKGNLKDWLNFPVWDEPEDCEIKLRFNGQESFYTRIKVSEASRQFLLARLRGLVADPQYGDSRLKALLRIAKFHHADETLKASHPTAEPEDVLTLWSNAFKEKLRQIEQTTCPVS